MSSASASSSSFSSSYVRRFFKFVDFFPATQFLRYKGEA